MSYLTNKSRAATTKAIAFLDEEPRRFDMSDWKTTWFDKGILTPPCGTAVCFAGALVTTHPEVKFEGYHPTGLAILDIIQDMRNIYTPANKLFYTMYWPWEFRECYYFIRDQAVASEDVDEVIDLQFWLIRVLEARMEHYNETGA